LYSNGIEEYFLNISSSDFLRQWAANKPFAHLRGKFIKIARPKGVITLFLLEI